MSNTIYSGRKYKFLDQLTCPVSGTTQKAAAAALPYSTQAQLL